jgi:hypothetical protein
LLLNSGRVVLPKIERLINQLANLERRVARSGKDSIDHAPGAHDDVANAVAGSVDRLVTRPAARAGFAVQGIAGTGGWNGSYYVDGRDRKVTKNPYSRPCEIDFSKINKSVPGDPRDGFAAGQTWLKR